MSEVKFVDKDYFTKNQYKVVTCRGFGNDTISFKIKNISLLSLASSGQINNTLMASAISLFEGKKGNDVTMSSLDPKGLNEVLKLVRVYCQAVMVEPSYSEVGELMSDDMLFAIFNAATSDANALIPSDEKPSNT